MNSFWILLNFTCFQMTILYSGSVSKIPSFFFSCLALLWTLAPFHVVPAETRSTQVLFKNSTLLTVMKHYHALEFEVQIWHFFIPPTKRINWFSKLFIIAKDQMILSKKLFWLKNVTLEKQLDYDIFCMNKHCTKVVSMSACTSSILFFGRFWLIQITVERDLKSKNGLL